MSIQSNPRSQCNPDETTLAQDWSLFVFFINLIFGLDCTVLPLEVVLLKLRLSEMKILDGLSVEKVYDGYRKSQNWLSSAQIHH